MPSHRTPRIALSRRRFLQSAGAAACALQFPPLVRPAGPPHDAAPAEATGSDGPAPTLVQLTQHLWIAQGPVTTAILRDANRALLIDCGGNDGLPSSLASIGIETVDQILFTHHHRDQACDAHRWVAAGARLVVPADEQQHFAAPEQYWNSPESRWHVYNQHPHHLMLTEAVPVAATVAGDDTLNWGSATIRVLATPGHTDGAVSYIVEVDGRRVAFCGDLICAPGQIPELWSLQKGITTTDYHGFLGARPQLKQSLARLLAANPDSIVPSHGAPIGDPHAAVALLSQRLDDCYDKYVAISALRHYFPQMFTEYAGRPDHMPIRAAKPVPACLRHFGTTWVLLSRDRAAFVMDCGGPNVVEELRRLVAAGQIDTVEALWVTHYHDDHVDAIPLFQAAFDCPCITDRHVAQVITDPMAWRLPCISPSRARVDRATADGESWQWHEYRLTAYHFPGQTLYHAGLLAETEDLRMLFVGDSFTPGGIDDYCTQNRNWLGAGVGFDRCVALIERLEPTHILNCHVNDAFDFTAEQCAFMRANLRERESRFGALFPLEHANYGMDESWIRCQPYEQRAAAGSQARIEVVVTNHSDSPRTASCRPALPNAWSDLPDASKPAPLPATAELVVAPHAEGAAALAIAVPPHAAPGRYVIAMDITYAGRPMPQPAEAIITVGT